MSFFEATTQTGAFNKEDMIQAIKSGGVSQLKKVLHNGQVDLGKTASEGEAITKVAKQFYQEFVATNVLVASQRREPESEARNLAIVKGLKILQQRFDLLVCLIESGAQLPISERYMCAEKEQSDPRYWIILGSYYEYKFKHEKSDNNRYKSIAEEYYARAGLKLGQKVEMLQVGLDVVRADTLSINC